MPPDTTEPQRLAETVAALKLSYVVVTSVDRDDLDDGGSEHFVRCVEAIKRKTPHVRIELLTPDFRANKNALEAIVRCGADKLAHNQETVRRLSPFVRPQSDYERSLSVLRFYSRHFDGPVKSSLMVGLGEREEEVVETMRDLYDAGVRELTIGQYLQPSPRHAPVKRYHSPAYFKALASYAEAIGFHAVSAGVLVRSSYYAERLGN
jgi:lipoic acid synthetase